MSFSFFPPLPPQHIPVPRWIFSLESSIIQQAIFVRRNIPFLCLWNYTWKALRVDSSYLGDRGRPYVTLGVVQFFWQTISCWDFLSACSHPEVVLCLLCLLGDRACSALLSLPPSLCLGIKSGWGDPDLLVLKPNWRTVCCVPRQSSESKVRRPEILYHFWMVGVYVPVIYDHSLKSQFKKSSQAPASFQEMTDTYSLLIQAVFSSPHSFSAICPLNLGDYSFFFIFTSKYFPFSSLGHSKWLLTTWLHLQQ